MGRIFTESRYASVVSRVALVIALGGGTAYAAILVTSKDIKNGNVKRVDIHRGAVNSAKVADGALRAADFKAGELPAGATGATRATGATGPAGPAGTPAAKFFAAGDADGSVQRSSGGVSVNKFGTELYRITFPASVDGCVAVASIGATTSGNNVVSGGAGATINPGIGAGVTTVLTSNGAAAVDRPWAIAVFC